MSVTGKVFPLLSTSPLRALMGKKELERMFDLSYQTLEIWIEKGILPQPVNRRPVFREVFAPNAPFKWDVDEVIEAYERMKNPNKEEEVITC